MDESDPALERTGGRQVATILFRLASSATGAAVALGLVLVFIDPPSTPLFLASFGGSSVFLFGLTRAPAAQPRALFGGHLIGAFTGAVCYHWFGDAVGVYVLALVLTLVLMLLTKTVHPPAGANPLIMMHSKRRWPLSGIRSSSESPPSHWLPQYGVGRFRE